MLLSQYSLDLLESTLWQPPDLPPASLFCPFLLFSDMAHVSNVSMRSKKTPNAINSYVIISNFDRSKKRMARPRHNRQNMTAEP